MKKFILILAIIGLSISSLFSQRTYQGYIRVKDSIRTDTVRANDYQGTWYGMDTSQVGSGSGYWSKNGNYLYTLNDSIVIGKDTANYKLDVKGDVFTSGNILMDGASDIRLNGDSHPIWLQAVTVSQVGVESQVWGFSGGSLFDNPIASFIYGTTESNTSFVVNYNGPLTSDTTFHADFGVKGNSYLQDTTLINYANIGHKNPNSKVLDVSGSSYFSDTVTITGGVVFDGEGFTFTETNTSLSQSADLNLYRGSVGIEGNRYIDYTFNIDSLDIQNEAPLVLYKDTLTQKGGVVIGGSSTLSSIGDSREGFEFTVNGNGIVKDTLKVLDLLESSKVTIDSVLNIQPSSSLITNPNIGDTQLVDDTLRVYTNNGWEKAW